MCNPQRSILCEVWLIPNLLVPGSENILGFVDALRLSNACTPGSGDLSVT